MTVETLVNQALDILGYKRHIGSIWEGTAAASVALDHYAETRDELFHELQPDWALRDATLVLLKTAPASYDPLITPWSSLYPPIPWKYEYAYPDDCAVPLSLKETPFFLPVWKPQASVFRLNITTSYQSILSNTPNGILTYIASVLNPDLWQGDFTSKFIMILAKKMEAGFAARKMTENAKPDNS